MIVAGAALAADPADVALRAERYWLAAEAYRARGPDDPAARAGLGRALAGAGACGEALERLAEVRASGRWTPTDAYFEGQCHEREGDTAAAIAAFEEAVALDDRHALSWYRLARLGDTWGAPEVAARARDALWTLPPGPMLVALADARRAVIRGEADADARLFELTPGPGADRTYTAEVALLEARRWLDLGDPERAIEQAIRAANLRPSDPEAPELLARAYQAAGLPELAAAARARPRLRLGR